MKKTHSQSVAPARTAGNAAHTHTTITTITTAARIATTTTRFIRVFSSDYLAHSHNGAQSVTALFFLLFLLPLR